jgi:hypothetical protein
MVLGACREVILVTVVCTGRGEKEKNILTARYPSGDECRWEMERHHWVIRISKRQKNDARHSLPSHPAVFAVADFTAKY